MEELHLNDPDHNPTSSELPLKRSVARERELLSTKMEQSSIEETHANQFEIQTNPVFLLKEGSGMTLLPANISKDVLLKPKSQNWYVILIKTD